MSLDVLVCREGTQWVAQALEVDMAAQGEGLLSAVFALGMMFDVRDKIVDEHALLRDPIAPLPRTPEPYFAAYAAGSEIGIMPLGVMRLARIRLGDSPMRVAGGAP